MKFDKDWKFNVLGVYNFKAPGKLDSYFDFIRKNHKNLKGDICEIGVFNGSSILATGILLKEIGSNKKVYGFDSFSGFPSYHINDNLEKFKELHDSGQITSEHFEDFKLNVKLKNLNNNNKLDASNISSSNDFSQASIDLLKEKINFLGLDNIILVDGDYKLTMPHFDQKTTFFAALMDCDLYESHKIALNFLWNRLTPNSYVFLDEYYSLKFPGARIAINEFFKTKTEKPSMHQNKLMDFERWYVKKI